MGFKVQGSAFWVEKLQDEPAERLTLLSGMPEYDKSIMDAFIKPFHPVNHVGMLDTDRYGGQVQLVLTPES